MGLDIKAVIDSLLDAVNTRVDELTKRVSNLESSEGTAVSAAPTNATYITETANATLTNEFALSSLADGILKHASGIPARAVPGTDYSLSSFAYIEEQQTSGTAGGTFTSGADRTRVLNTEVFDPSGIVSIASNQFTLIAGTYIIAWDAPAYKVDVHQSFLYNITASAEVARGSSSQADTGANVPTLSSGRTLVTIGSSTTYEIRHRCGTTHATNGLGVASSFGTEVYTRVFITKIA